LGCEVVLSSARIYGNRGVAYTARVIEEHVIRCACEAATNIATLTVYHQLDSFYVLSYSQTSRVTSDDVQVTPRWLDFADPGLRGISGPNKDPKVSSTFYHFSIYLTIDGDCDALLNQDSVVAYQNANEASSIYELYKSCIKNYTRLCGAVDATISETATQNGYDRALTLASIRDDLSRFKAWATNIAAHQPERLASSLDARLKGADETRERVLKILDDLEDSLHSGQ
jgi:hypothetical protein